MLIFFYVLNFNCQLTVAQTSILLVSFKLHYNTICSISITDGLFCSFFFPKAEELKIHIQNEHIMWVTQYLVMKRASIEPNFHQLYLEFMESLELTNFAREVLKETYRNIKVCSYGNGQGK